MATKLHITTIHYIGLVVVFLALSSRATLAKEYYYTRNRDNPQHLRISEEFKNKYVNEIKYESKINGTKYQYYKSTLSMSHDELVFETIDKIFRHRLSPFYIHHYDTDEDKRRSSDPRLVSPEACARDLMYLVDKLPKRSSLRNSYANQDEDHMTPELTAFFDSYGRQEAGLLMGNTYWVGAYDQCVNRHIFELTSSLPAADDPHQAPADNHHHHRLAADPDQKVVSFKGRYCVSALKSPAWDSIIKSRKMRSKSYFKSERQANNYQKLFRLQVGICLPDSCDSNSLERHMDEIKLLSTFMMEPRYADYELIDLYCLPDETSPLRQWSGASLNFLIFISVWCTFLFLATIADVFDFVDILDASRSETRKLRRLRQLVEWLSLRTNYRKLMRVSEEHSQTGEDSHKEPQHSTELTKANTKLEVNISLRFLNAFKVLIMFWIVNGHIMLLMIQTAKNILYSDALLNGLMHFLIGATFGVDLFFTMTGFLTSYLMFNSGHAYKMKPATWLYLSFHRYWRLAPMYLLTFWFSRSVMQLLGSGPLWDYGTSSLTFRGLCNSESWWYPLTLTSNLHGLFDECMITSWYISCDMQFWLVSPIFIHLLAKSPLNGWLVSLTTIVASSKVRYDAILRDKSARHDELVQPRADIFMRVSHDLPALYTHPHYRIAAYIVGLLAGHYVYMIKSGKWRSSIAAAYSDEQARANGRAAELVPSNGHHQRRVAEQNFETTTTTTEQANTYLACTKTYETTTTTTKTTKKKITKNKNKIELMTKTIKIDQIDDKRTSMRNWFAYGGLFLILVMAFVSHLLANFFPQSLLRHSRAIASIAYSIDHLIMSIGASLLIISLCFGQWSNLVKILSHPNWTRLSKMNYALLLLQCEAIYFQIFRYEQVPVAGTRELINILFNLLVTLYPLAFVVTLAFEFPLANLEKLIIPTKAGGERSQRRDRPPMQLQQQQQPQSQPTNSTTCKS